MKVKVISIAVILLLIVGGIGYYKFFGSADAQNKWGRKRVELKAGDYEVTYAVQGFNKSWSVVDGKITSVPEKGYYFFFVGKKYVQLPISSTIIEEK